MPLDSSCIPVLCHSGTCSTGMTIPPPIPLECNTHRNGNIGRALCHIFIPPDSTGFRQEWGGQCEDLEIMVVGHMCSYEGRVPTIERIKVIMDWAPCIDQSQLRAFMGTIGVLRIFIPNFSRRAKDLTKLLRMKIPWEWGVDQDEGMRALKEGCLVVKALKPIDY